MLVLGRTIGEVIVIGDNIRVKVLSVKANRVQLGIEAPNDVRVKRDDCVCDELHGRQAPTGGPADPC